MTRVPASSDDATSSSSDDAGSSSSDDSSSNDDSSDSCSEITFETNLITANLGPAGNPTDDIRYVFRQSIVDSLYYIDSIDQVIITSEDPVQYHHLELVLHHDD